MYISRRFFIFENSDKLRNFISFDLVTRPPGTTPGLLGCHHFSFATIFIWPSKYGFDSLLPIIKSTSSFLRFSSFKHVDAEAECAATKTL